MLRARARVTSSRVARSRRNTLTENIITASRAFPYRRLVALSARPARLIVIGRLIARAIARRGIFN